MIASDHAFQPASCKAARLATMQPDADSGHAAVKMPAIISLYSRLVVPSFIVDV
jgi:hypothetical protein